ncbi:MAG: hypothetical protein LBH98_04005 [Chitinispirillales bacterium]|jgi:hypothetical protein|nr:hypothetical protein [Chitinispirillales bacterium]
MNWDNIDWDNFSCVDMARKVKDEMSIKLNATTLEERHLFYERSYERAVQMLKKGRQESKREKAK